MKKKHKRQLSLLTGLAMAASALTFTVPEAPEKETMPRLRLAEAAVRPTGEMFSELTVRNGRLYADGKRAGTSYGGVTLNDDEELTFNVDGRDYTLQEAQQELGVEIRSSYNGETVVTSPFAAARIIVRADGDFDSCGAASVIEEFDGIYALCFNTVAEAYSAFKTLSDDPAVIYAEPDLVCVNADMGEDDEEEEDEEPLTAWDLGGWGASAIGSQEYCRRLKEEKGELPEIVVAVIDTGIYSEHNALKDRVLKNGANFTLIDNDSPEDDNGHGTHCAGIIASSTNDNVKLMPVKVMEARGIGYNLSIYAGIKYAVDNGADILSMSIGGISRSHLYDDAVAYAEEHGVSVITASGNSGYVDNSEYCSSFPCIDYCVNVGSVSKELEWSVFSNRGNVDFAAPGEEILSSVIGGENNTEEMSGTSMAAPFVAACFADVYSYDPTYTHEQVYELIKANTLDVCEPGFDSESGWGMVNLSNFHYETYRVAPPIPSIRGGSFNETVSVTFTCADKDSDIYYTTDGTTPSAENGTKYDGTPVVIEETTNLKAVAVNDGYISRCEELMYYINELAPDAIRVEDGMLCKYSGSSKYVDFKKLVEEGQIPAFDRILDRTFEQIDTIEEVVFPDSVTEIPDGLFANKVNLRRVTTSASLISADAFRGCDNLEEVVDSNITEVGEGAFSGCISLQRIDLTKIKEIKDSAFECTGHLTSDCFDPGIITVVEKDAFKNSALSGVFDMPNLEELGESAFRNTSITRVSLGDRLDNIPDHAFYGCKELKYISAPAVKNIEEYGLALGKDRYAPDTVVETDINFSKLKYAYSHAFDGYVFDGEISFDSLHGNDTLACFEGAYGSVLRFPTMYDANIYNSPIYADLVVMPYLIRFDKFNCIDQNVAFLVGTDERVFISDEFADPDREDPAVGKDVKLYTTVESDAARAVAERDGCTYKVLPALHCPSDHYTMLQGTSQYITAYSLGEGVTGAWFTKTAEGLTALDTPGDEPVVHNADTAGTFTYVYRAYDSDGKMFDEAEITVDVPECEPKVIKENGFDLFDEENSITTKNGDKVMFMKFTAETGGRYSIESNRVEIECRDEKGEEFKLKRGGTMRCYVELEKGRTYDIKLTFTPSDEASISNKGLPYFTICTEDFGRICIASCYECFGVVWSAFSERIENYVPRSHVYNGNYKLKYGIDYIITSDEPFHYGTNRYRIEGIGNYYGILTEDTVELKQDLVEDVWYEDRIAEAGVDASENKDTDGEYDDGMDNGTASEKELPHFTPLEEGAYKFVAIPAKKLIEEVRNSGSTFNYKNFDPLFFINGELRDVPLDANIVDGYMFDPEERGYVYEGFSLSEHNCTSIIKLPVDVAYSVEPRCVSGCEFMITRRTTLDECRVEYEKTYKYTGSEIIPEVKVIAPDGKVLREGRDYTMEVVCNTEPGEMSICLFSRGDYPGSILLDAVIEGGGITYDAEGELTVLTDVDTRLNAATMYRLYIEEDSFVKMEPDERNNLKITNKDYSFKEYVDFSGDEMYLPAGTYYLRYLNKSAPMEFRCSVLKDTKKLRDAEITVIPPVIGSEDIYPQVKVMYDGELLDEEAYTLEYSVDKETDEPVPEDVFSTVTVKGNYPYCGEITVGYFPFPENIGECKVLKEGVNSVCADYNGIEGVYSWTPEADHYVFFCDEYEAFRVEIAEEDGRVIMCDFIWDTGLIECDVEAGKRYLVRVRSNNSSTFDMTVSSDIKPLSHCDVEYDEALNINDIDSAEVIFKDGGYTLVEGTDYYRMNCGGCNGLGNCEFVYKGMGKYCGQAIALFHVYSDTLPVGRTFDVPERAKLRASSEGEKPGAMTVLRFTADRAGTSEYRFNAMAVCRIGFDPTFELDKSCGPEMFRSNNGKPIQYTTVLVYDENGNYLGMNDYADSVVMKQGETRYFVVIVPYNWETDQQYDEWELDLWVDHVKQVEDKPEPDEPSAPVTATTTAVTTASTETTSVTAVTTVTATAETTASTSTSTASKASSADTTLPPATTTTAPETGKLPETGCGRGYAAVLTAAAAMFLVGAGAYVSARKRDESEG